MGRPLNPVLASLPVTIFEEMSGLARRHGAVNLGQGFPDTPGPQDLCRAAGEALMAGLNQYPPMRGLDETRAAVARHYSRAQGLDVGPEHVVVTSGATEALAASLLAILCPGEEVIVIDPAYDAYRPLVARAGGVAVSVPLSPPDWRLDIEAIGAAITPRTRAILFNNPMNPCARAFDGDEIAALAALCVAHDLVAISDEVWEQVVFDGHAHRPLCAFPGMAGRTVKIGSAGKMFSMTGWKVGFACGQGALIEAVAKAHQFLTFTTPPALQRAVAVGLDWPAERFEAMRAGFQRSRDRLDAALRDAGYAVLDSQATYFVCVDLPGSGIGLDDRSFCLAAVQEHGVAAIPVSAFMAQPGRQTGIIRLCLAKSDATLDEGVRRLARAREALGSR